MRLTPRRLDHGRATKPRLDEKKRLVINGAAHDDYVAHDETALEDFRAMASLGCDIQDLPNIHNPEVARVIGSWVEAEVGVPR